MSQRSRDSHVRVVTSLELLFATITITVTTGLVRVSDTPTGTERGIINMAVLGKPMLIKFMRRTVVTFVAV
ncbi:hypothetical protein K449DRAFT_392793 [Hypoxylon sp. EC38]|nr:hypothetical protein K449DRAFT_392793 [Hypoxylon sp. EC38]